MVTKKELAQLKRAKDKVIDDYDRALQEGREKDAEILLMKRILAVENFRSAGNERRQHYAAACGDWHERFKR